VASGATDLSTIAPGLTRDADGIWRARVRSAIDYPDEAHAFCFSVEEQSFWFNYRNRFIVEAVRCFPPGGPIADIGAGNGYVALGLARAGFSTLVIEPGATGAKNASSRGLEPVVSATLSDAGFLPETLHAAGLFDVLEHIDDDRAFLTATRQLLTQRGRLYVTVPAFEALWSSEDELVGHHRRYTVRSLTEVLTASGFAVDYATYLFAPLALPLFLLRTLPSRIGRRRTLDPARTAAELRPPTPLAVRLISALLEREVRRVRQQRSIAVGTSCLAVARAVPSSA
jgi:SAM-dependent methyltransferase